MQKCFYTQLVAILPAPIIPLYAIEFVDSTVDVARILQNAVNSAVVDIDYNEDDYFDEYDIPEAEEIK